MSFPISCQRRSRGFIAAGKFKSIFPLRIGTVSCICTSAGFLSFGADAAAFVIRLERADFPAPSSARTKASP